jgi:hypothetical protein
MKNKALFLLPGLIVIGLSCSLFSQPAQPTEAPEPFFGPTRGPLTFAPESLPDAKAGTAYEAQIRITQNITPVDDMTVSSGSLPAGLEFIKVDGEDAATIRGTPTESGSFTFTVDVWCFGTQVSGQTGQKEYTILVNE